MSLFDFLRRPQQGQTPIQNTGAVAGVTGDPMAFAPPEQQGAQPNGGGGLGGMLSRLARPDAQGNTLLDRLGVIGAGLTDIGGSTQNAAANQRNLIASRRETDAKNARLQQLNALAEQLGMSPRERLIFMADPEEWAKQNATRLAFHEGAGGSTSHFGDPDMGGHDTFNPQVGQVGGELYGIASPTQANDLGGLAQSPQQKAAEAEAAAKLAEEQRYHDQLDRYHGTMGDAAVTRSNRPPAGRGGGGASTGLPAGWVVEH